VLFVLLLAAIGVWLILNVPINFNIDPPGTTSTTASTITTTVLIGKKFDMAAKKPFGGKQAAPFGKGKKEQEQAKDKGDTKKKGK